MTARTDLNPSGFVLGLLVSVFSKTLVLLIGLGIVAIQVLYSRPTYSRPQCRSNVFLDCFAIRHRHPRTVELEETGSVLAHPLRLEQTSRIRSIIRFDLCSIGFHVLLTSLLPCASGQYYLLASYLPTYPVYTAAQLKRLGLPLKPC